VSDQDPKPVRGFAKLVALFVAARTARRAVAGREPPPAGRAGTESELDPSERTVPASARAEMVVAALLFAAAVLAFGFTALYIVEAENTQLLGLSLGLALALLAAALIVAGRFVVPQETHVEDRGPLLVEDEAEEVTAMIESGGEGVSRRVLLTGAGGVAGAAIVTAAATPLASLGPNLKQIHTTPWKRGVRLIDDRGQPYSADQIQIGSLYTALPEHEDAEQLGAGLVVVRLPADQIHLPSARRDWAPQGILAYSKICPHAGCAIALYRYPTYQPTSAGPAFTCPCHYSTFSPGEGGRLIFGPAGRSLPQLPLMIDAAGYLRAAGPFHEDIGPAWWNVRRSES
jgi:ubiquinol-cytochrome c reductase iron-sulfur subunit